MATQAVDQLALDETIVDEPTLETALEERQRRKIALREVRKRYDEAAEAANGEIAKLELPIGKAIRCGRFRITRDAVDARSIAFETEATSRIRIRTIGDQDASA